MRRSSRSKLTFTLAEGLPSPSWLLLSLRQRVGGTEKSSSPPLYALGLAQCLMPGRHSHICLTQENLPHISSLHFSDYPWWLGTRFYSRVTHHVNGENTDNSSTHK